MSNRERIIEIFQCLKRAKELAQYTLWNAEGEDAWIGAGTTHDAKKWSEVVAALDAAETTLDELEYP